MPKQERPWMDRARRAIQAARIGDLSGVMDVHFLICLGHDYDAFGTSVEELEGFMHQKALLESRRLLNDCRTKPPRFTRAMDIELNMVLHGVTLDEIEATESEIRGYLLREARGVLELIRLGTDLAELTADLDVYLAADRLCSHITPESLSMTAKDAALVHAGALQRALCFAEQIRLGKEDARFALNHEIVTYGLTQHELGFTDEEMRQFRPSSRPPAHDHSE